MASNTVSLDAGGATSIGVSTRLHSVPDALRMLGGMGRTWFYGEVAAGRIRVVKLGKRTLVPDAEVRRIIADAVERAKV